VSLCAFFLGMKKSKIAVNWLSREAVFEGMKGVSIERLINVLNRQLPLVIACSLLSSRGLAADVLTYHNNNARTGLNPAETILTPQSVNANGFGLIRNLPVDGLHPERFIAAISIHQRRNARSDPFLGF
jgi:hypothetical protein